MKPTIKCYLMKVGTEDFSNLVYSDCTFEMAEALAQEIAERAPHGGYVLALYSGRSWVRTVYCSSLTKVA